MNVVVFFFLISFCVCMCVCVCCVEERGVWGTLSVAKLQSKCGASLEVGHLCFAFHLFFPFFFFLSNVRFPPSFWLLQLKTKATQRLDVVFLFLRVEEVGKRKVAARCLLRSPSRASKHSKCRIWRQCVRVGVVCCRKSVTSTNPSLFLSLCLSLYKDLTAYVVCSVDPLYRFFPGGRLPF